MNGNMKKYIGLLAILLTQLSYAQDWIEPVDDSINFDLRGAKVMVVLADDFDYHEAVYIPNLLVKWGATVYYAGDKKEVNGFMMSRNADGEFEIKQGRKIKTDLLIKEAFHDGYDMIYFPGGNSPNNILNQKRNRKYILKLCKDAFIDYKLLAGMSQGALILAEAGLLEEEKFVSTKDVKNQIVELGGINCNKEVYLHRDLLTGKWPYFSPFAVLAAQFLEQQLIKRKKF